MSRKIESEMYPIIEEWESTSENMTTFCARHQIPKSTFSYWRTRYSKSKKLQKDQPGFTELVSEPVCTDLEIHYPNGVKLRVSSASSLTQLRALIQLV